MSGLAARYRRRGHHLCAAQGHGGFRFAPPGMCATARRCQRRRRTCADRTAPTPFEGLLRTLRSVGHRAVPAGGEAGMHPRPPSGQISRRGWGPLRGHLIIVQAITVGMSVSIRQVGVDSPASSRDILLAIAQWTIALDRCGRAS